MAREVAGKEKGKRKGKEPFSTGFSEKSLRQLAEQHERLIGREKNQVYFIEDNEEMIFIPGGRRLLRKKYIYDPTSKMLVVLRPLRENVEIVKDQKMMKKLDKIIQHPVQSLHKGIFVRQFDSSRFYPDYFYLLQAVHGCTIPRTIDPKTGKKETMKRYNERKQQYLNYLFQSVISEG